MFPISPGVATREFQTSATVEQGAFSVGAIAGKFAWGPVGTKVRVSSESNLVQTFGKPTSTEYLDFMLSSSYLSYSGSLDVVRIGSTTTVFNAVDTGSPVSILNQTEYELHVPTSCTFLARFPGTAGNSLRVDVCASASAYSVVLPGTFAFTISNVATYTPAAAELLADYVHVGDTLVIGGSQYSVSALTTTTVTFSKVYIGSTTITSATRLWKHASRFTSAPVANEFHMVVVDTTGYFGDAAETILESYTLSTVVGAVNTDGTQRYWRDAFTQYSRFVLSGSNPLVVGSGISATASVLAGGADGFGSMTLADYIQGYDQFKDSDTSESGLLIGGNGCANGGVLAQYLVQNIAEVRKDAVVFLSPQLTSVQTKDQEVTLCRTDRDLVGSSSYFSFDSNWKYTYDRYNNKFRWIPCNADSAGLYAQAQRNGEVWTTGVGMENGRLKNVTKLAWNPSQNARDQLYPAGINPIFSKAKVGPVLYGDKTGQTFAGPFDRMHNRFLFITLRKTIAVAAEALLFKFNDEVSQRRFYSLTEPFLREIQGRGGIADFIVQADSTVNTPDVISQNRFVGKIFIKTKGSINFILLDFTAVGPNVDFKEVIVG
jgi:hypothetical protein